MAPRPLSVYNRRMPPKHITLRDAGAGDAGEIVRLIGELALAGGETSPLDPAYLRRYLDTPSSRLLLACLDGQVVGLLSYSTRPDLYHAGDSCLIEELVVAQGWRGRGIGSTLLAELLRRAQQMGCKEVSVSAMPDNPRALQFYRRHGLVDEAVFLEKHFPGDPR